MTSNPSSHYGRRRTDSETEKAAAKYVEMYPRHVIKYLADQCDPVELLKEACRFENHDYHRIMADYSGSEEETKSQTLHRRTFSNNSQSHFTSSSSAIFTSSDSSDGRNTLWVVSHTSSSGFKPLGALIVPHSDYLIRVDAIDRLGLKYERASGVDFVRYDGGSMCSLGTISLEWTCSMKDAKSNKLRRSTFFVVEDLLEGDAIIGDSESNNNSNHQRASIRNNVTRNPAYDDEAIEESTPHAQSLHFQQPSRANTFTANSTATARQSLFDKGHHGQNVRRQSNVSENSRIPKPRMSPSSVGSASANQSRVPAARRPNEGSLHPPPATQPGFTSGVSVTVYFGKSVMTLKLELDAEGAVFYESLQEMILRKTRRELNRVTDSVRFTLDKKHPNDGCHVLLMEDEVAENWETAVEWIKEQRDEGISKIYAIVGPDD